MDFTLKSFGKASAAVLKNIIGSAFVGKDELCNALGYVENAGVPTSVVPDFIGQMLFDTSGLDFYRAFGTSSGNWALAGIDTLAFAELALLDGALSTNAVASKAAIIDSTGILTLSNNKLAVEAGAGITGGSGTIYKTRVASEGGIITTEILIDLTGLGSSTTDGDIIGVSTPVAHLGQITAARNGTILTGTVTCLEVPVGGVTDIDLFYATAGTGKFDDAVSGLAGQTSLLSNGGAWTLALTKAIADFAASADKFIYLVNGAAGTVGTYSAGKFLITLKGY